MTFKTRIATNYLLATSVVIALVFVIIYCIVQTTIYRELDDDLNKEIIKHKKEISAIEGVLTFYNKAEMQEREHRESEVNPVFIELLNAQKQVTDKTPNLKNDWLKINPSVKPDIGYNAFINQKPIRQMHSAVVKDDATQGYIISAISMGAYITVLKNLRNTLFILYPFIILILFLISKYLAGKSIAPIQKITTTTDRISKNNLNHKVPLPKNKDELYALTLSINNLLNRLKYSFDREKQFTSDAAHELKTPLAVLKGTLQVLLRKPRSKEEYITKIEYALKEIEHMIHLSDQLLILARLDNLSWNKHTQPLIEIIEKSLQQYGHDMIEKDIAVKTHFLNVENMMVNDTLYHLIINNLISNAVKFSNHGSIIHLNLTSSKDTLIFQIENNTTPIESKNMEYLFNPFFRVRENATTKGSGLGLSIAKKAADLLDAKIIFHQNIEAQTITVEVIFPLQQVQQ